MRPRDTRANILRRYARAPRCTSGHPPRAPGGVLRTRAGHGPAPQAHLRHGASRAPAAGPAVRQPTRAERRCAPSRGRAIGEMLGMILSIGRACGPRRPLPAPRSGRGTLGGTSPPRVGLVGRRPPSVSRDECLDPRGTIAAQQGPALPGRPADVREIVAVTGHAGDGLHGTRLGSLITVLWRAGLRIHEALASAGPTWGPADLVVTPGTSPATRRGDPLMPARHRATGRPKKLDRNPVSSRITAGRCRWARPPQSSSPAR